MKVIRSLSSLQKGSESAFIPIHVTATGPRTRSRVTIWNLPEEILILLLKELHIKELLNMRAVHPYFRNLIDNSLSIWSVVNFQDSWPSANNIKHFENAASQCNVEALVKLALAHLYNEGLPGDKENKQITHNGFVAAEMFCKVERLCSGSDPFCWLFIRPPWSLNGACCKECVFTYLRIYLRKVVDPKIQICVVKTIMLLGEEGGQQETMSLLEEAKEQGSAAASFMLWEKKYINNQNLEPSEELESIRELRDIASSGNLNAQLTLCHYYASSKFGGLHQTQAAAFIRDFVHSSKSSSIQKIFRCNHELTPNMRYILVDWLVEVAEMKELSSQTLHASIALMDRYLKIHPTSRGILQLLGVVSMLVCSRYLGKDIITIREAAWLTDNTYKYEDVVKMMGEIVATLKGSIRRPTSLDFAAIFCLLDEVDSVSHNLVNYICELCLLHSELGQYSAAEMAASAFILSRIILKSDLLWPEKMVLFTGVCLRDLSACVIHIHRKCFFEGVVIDHRDVVLQAVKLRYSNENFDKVSDRTIPHYGDVCSRLGMASQQQISDPNHRRKCKNTKDLIMSPSRKKAIKRSISEKDFFGVPTTSNGNNSTQIQLSPSLLNESVLSGYEGDEEDSVIDNDLEHKPMDVPSTCSCDPADCGVGGMTAAPVRYQGRSYIVFTRSATSSSTTAASSHVDSLPNGSSDNSNARQGSPCSQPDGCNLCHLLDIRSQARTVYDSGTEEDSDVEDDNAKFNPAFMRTRSRVRPHCVVGSSFKRKCKTQIGSASKTFVIP
ncbi:cyclin-F-like isoform X2 [Octopus vulgaris]|uniref:Cyclin-F-like isoform X2 n=2 Tax=Octopus TaxID=6643 RepID=A0AA36AQV1_OCTVU|nr:cyclin-F-like isoform X2 [Octopus sinensis]CAI9720459.1 cyclin-F-like isoform X2 [Octopus vulgaris]